MVESEGAKVLKDLVPFLVRVISVDRSLFQDFPSIIIAMVIDGILLRIQFDYHEKSIPTFWVKTFV